MKYSFFLNWMGPVALSWYEDNNIPYTEETRWSDLLGEHITIKTYNPQYCSGRIDIGPKTEENPWGLEYGVGIMEQESWYKLSKGLNEVELYKLPSRGELFRMFEEEAGHKIKWFKGGMYD